MVKEHNKRVESQLATLRAPQEALAKEIAQLESEIVNHTDSIAAGVDARTVSYRINSKAARINKLKALAEVPIPQKISAKDLRKQMAEVRHCDPELKRSMIRRYIAAMDADPEEKKVYVRMHAFAKPRCILKGGSARGPMPIPVFEISFCKNKSYPISFVG